MIACGLVAAAAVVPICYSQAQQAPATAAAAAPAAAPVSPEQAKKAFSYFIGYKFGQEMAMGAKQLTGSDFDKDVFFQGVNDSLAGSIPTISQEDLEAGMDAFVSMIEEREKVAAQENLTKGEAFRAEFAKQEGVVKTESGLLYRVLTPGEGRKYDEAQDGKDALCMVTYEGKFIDGKTFDKAETPVPMPVNGVVPGFAEALKLMPIGAEWEVCIPSDLAYGTMGAGPIQGNSTLVFTLKMTDIQKNDAPAQQTMQLTPEMIQQLQAQGLEVVADEDEEDEEEEAPAAPEAAEAPAAE